MKHAHSPLRPGMTAIAAVLALSSTALVAQSIEAPVSEPVTVAPSQPNVASTTAAPAPQSSTTATVAPALNIPRITVDINSPVAETIATAESQVKAKQVPVQPRVAVQTASAVRVARPAAQVAALSPTVTEERNIATVPPVIDAPVLMKTPSPVVKPQPVTKAEAGDDILPIAGIAGIGALLFAGGALALSRRRRVDEEQDIEILPETVAAQPVQRADLVNPEPITAYAPIAANGPTSTLPAGFDLSRYGRHVQAAYHGPTIDNPSLSLRNRLRRANFFDLRERQAAESVVAKTETRADGMAAAKAEPAIGASWTERAVSRPSKQPRTNFRPAYQS